MAKNAKKPAGRPYRHELKYIITEGEYHLLTTRLRNALHQDENAGEDSGGYFIRSLYFDDPWDSAVMEKVSGADSRDKFRIRIYNLSDAMIKLERKHKEGSYIKKDSLSLTREECDDLIAGHIEFLFERPEPLAKVFYGIFRMRHLRPKVLVDYDREAYVFPAEDVRITFDKNVRTAMRSTDLFNPDVPTYPVWDYRNCLILEVKFNASLPDYVRSLIQLESAQRTAASKYLFCRQYDFIGGPGVKISKR